MEADHRDKTIQSFAQNILRLGNECRALADENKALKAEVKQWKGNHRIVIEDRNTLLSSLVNLKAEVERLRKAGDAMKSAYYNSQFAGMVPPEENPDTEEVMVRVDNAYKAVEEAMANWNAAKEGKPSV